MRNPLLAESIFSGKSSTKKGLQSWRFHQDLLVVIVLTPFGFLPHLPGEGCYCRFYQSCCPPSPPPPPPPPVSPRPCLHQLPPPLPPCQLFAKLFANFRAQCALLDLNLGPSQLSAHRWTSTWDLPSSVRTAGPPPWDLPSSVRTAGPQPGTFRALSAHCWTSTWDLPSSVRTAGPPLAGPQRPDRMPEDMPDRMSDRMPEDMPGRYARRYAR